MISCIVTISAIVATAQAKAIITNRCPQPVYIWSVPSANSIHTDNLQLPSGARYEEPWRRGTVELPGIALKISSQPNGIFQGKDEINFAYSIDPIDRYKLWVDLSSIRGTSLDNIALYTCRGLASSLNTLTQECRANDDVELVLCGGQRSSAAKDSASMDQIFKCYGDNNNKGEGNGHHGAQRHTSLDVKNSTARYLFYNTTHTSTTKTYLSYNVVNTLSSVPKGSSKPTKHSTPKISTTHTKEKPVTDHKYKQPTPKPYKPPHNPYNGPSTVSHGYVYDRPEKPKATRKYDDQYHSPRPSSSMYDRHGSNRRSLATIPHHCMPKVSQVKLEAKNPVSLKWVMRELAADNRGMQIDQGDNNKKSQIAGHGQGHQGRLSICTFCAPAIPGADCAAVWATISSVFLLHGLDMKRDFHSHDWLNEDCSKHPKPPRKHDGKPAVCVRDVCSRLAYKERECDRLEKELTVAWEHRHKSTLKYDVDYTTDDDACGDY